MSLPVMTLLIFSFITFLFGMPLLVTGTYLIGGVMVGCASVGIWYALRRSQIDALHQLAYDRAYRARIDAYTTEVMESSL